MAEDHEQAVVARTRQGAGVALATMQLQTRVNIRWVVPGFPGASGRKSGLSWLTTSPPPRKLLSLSWMWRKSSVVMTESPEVCLGFLMNL